jgi:16S rRNA (cytosine967-C5)-methyltransferase
VTSEKKSGGSKVKTGTGHGRGHGKAPVRAGAPRGASAGGAAGRGGQRGQGSRKGGHGKKPRGPGSEAPRRGRRVERAETDPASRPLRLDQIDASVLQVHGLVHDQGWLADRALERALRESRLFAAERRAVAESVYGITRWQGQLDWLLAGPGGAPPSLATRYAGWLVRFGDATADQAARRLAVPAAALRGLAGAEGRLAALTDPVERLALRGSLPFWLARRFVEELGEAEAVALVSVLNERAPLTVRANLLRGTRDELRATLSAEGTEATPTRFSPWGLTLDGHRNAFALPSFKAGRFEIQDEGSQLIALCCGARSGWTVVDACAGAGGKSLALAAEMRNRGTLWALDSDAGRLEEARRRGRRDGVDNLRVRAIAADGAADAQLEDLAGQADVVLIDAPCSGLGTLRRKPDARWRLAPGDPEKFAALQKSLAERFSRLVKPGGRLVYATCAIGRTENGAVAEFISATLPFDPAPLLPLLGAERAAALGVDGHTLQLLPHRHGTDGFFMAAFTRRKG